MDSDIGRLSISRKDGESVLIRTADGDLIRLTASKNHGKIQLSFVAPKRVRIERAEFLEGRQ